MATREEILTMIRLMEESKPVDFFKKMNESEAGISAVLRFLYESGKPVTAGVISRSVGVSTARIAVLLKKMAARGLIIRESGAEDARTTVARLTEKGRSAFEYMFEDFCNDMGQMIDRVGMDRLLEFTAIAREITAVMKGPPELHDR